MKKNNPVDKAQSGRNVPNTPTAPPTSPLDEGFMEEKYGGYQPSSSMGDVVRYSSKGKYATTPGDSSSDITQDLTNYLASPGDKGFTVKGASLDKFAEARTGRYKSYLPGYDMEEAEALGQSSFDKAISGVTKGLGLMGTTFINSTVNLAYGAVQWGKTGQFSSFYDNDLTRSLDEFNKGLEDSMPNYYTQAERNAKWNDPNYFFTANFLWDGVVKNLGFAAGAALSGAAFTSALKALPLTARLFAAGKGAQALSATEAGLASNTGKVANSYGKLLQLNKEFASGYNSMNAGGRAVVAGLATSGEASIEAMHNMHELKDTLVQEFIDENGYTPSASDMERIEEAAAGAGNKAFLANVALLTATNYIQFPKILGSTYRGEKNVANGLIRETRDVVQEGGKYIAKSKYPKLATLGRAVKNPYLFSYSEAFEEVSQFTAAVATKDYYKKKSQGEAANWVESFGVGIKEGMLSDEGAKNALIGGISGAIMMGPGKVGAARKKKRDTENLVSALNSSDLKTAFSKFTQETNDSVERAAVLQKERMSAIKDGRVLESKDLEADYIINYLTPRIKYGRLDLVQAEIAEYKKLASTKEGFNELVAEGKALESDTRESFIARLEKFEQTTNNINTLWQSINLRYSALRDDKGAPLYDEDVINKMIYTSGKVADYDQRIPQVTQDLTNAGIDVAGLTQSLLEGNLDEFDKAYAQIENLNSVSKDELQEKLKDVSEMILRRQEFFNTYEDIKANPSNFKEVKVSEDSPLATKQTIKIKTKRGERDIEIGTAYFAGKGVDYSKDPIDKKIQVSRFVVEGVTEDNKIKIKNLDTGKVSTVTADQFENFNVSKESLLKGNPTANFFFEHRNEMFEYNFGKNFGGKRRGRLEYKDNKLYFVYLDPKGKVTSKLVINKDFVPQGEFKYAKVRQVGSVRDRKQGDARESFMTSKEIKEMDAGLKQTREDRLSLISQLGEQAKEELKNITEKLAKQTEQLAKVKEDLKNIQKMKETGEKIKLNFSKATKSFTRSLNILAKMQTEIEAEIESLEALKDENEFNIEYFESFSEEMKDSDEDNQQFIKELQDQQKLLKDNGVNLSSAIDKAKKLSDVTKKAIKSATKMFRNAIKSTYIVDQDYSEYLSDLLDQVASGENLQETWPLLKQEMVNFALTSDLSKDTNINESLLLKALDDVNQLTEDLNAMRAEYKARKTIIDRFQLAINELNARKAEEERLANNAKLVEQALKSGSTEPQVNFFASDKKFEPTSKKPVDRIYKSTIGVDSSYSDNSTIEPHQERANKFGFNLESFDNRDGIRGVYVTAKTEALLGLSGLMDLILNNVSGEERKQELKDKAIVMVMVDESGELVGVDGQPIPQGEVLLDNVIFQAMPASGFRNGAMFRDGTTKEQVDAVNKQYNKWIDGVLSQTAIGTPQKIEASFGIPQVKRDENGNKIYTTTTSVEDAGLVSEVEINEGDPLIEIPTLGQSADQGTTNYSNSPGSVYLTLKNGLVKLKNRLHTDAEASAIYDVLLELSKVMVSEKGGITSDKAIKLLNFLRGTVYWGVPETQQGERKDPGNNSIFFEKDKKTGRFMLVMSNKGEEFLFTPTGISANKELMLETLGGMYNNVSKTKANNTNQKFTQIISVSTEGEIKSVTWPNYQSYLLSKKKPDGTEREGFELPLFTIMEPLEEGETNRKGIYFYTSNTADDFEIPEPAVQKAAAKSKPNYTIPKTNKVTYLLDGETRNTYTSPAGKIIFFKAKASKNGIKVDDVTIVGNPESDLAEVMDNMRKAGKTEDQIKQAIKVAVFNAIAPQAAEDARQGKFEDSYIPELPPDVNNPVENDPRFAFKGGKPSAPAPIQAPSAPEPAPVPPLGDPRFAFSEGNGTSNEPLPQTSEVEALQERVNIIVESNMRDAFNLVIEDARQRGETIKGLNVNDVLDGINKEYKELEKAQSTLKKYYGNTKISKLTKEDIFELEDFITTHFGLVERFLSNQQTSDFEEVAEESDFEEVADDDEFNDLLNNYAEDDGDETRQVIDRLVEETENWSEVEKWMSKNFPMVPLYRVKNILQYEDGIKEAWGVFSKGAIYVYENAEVGTVYHEVFEGVWKTFTTAKEQENVLKEFRSRKGTFVDRPTGKTIKYSEATNQEVKEQLAEEFRDFILKKKAPKSGSLISKLWKQLKSFIERAILGKGFTEELFTRIDSGGFKGMKSPFGSQLSLANKGVIDIESKVVRKGDEARDKILNDKVTTDTIQEMTYQMLKSLVANDKNIFELQPISEKEMYKDIYEKVMNTVESQAATYNKALSDPAVPEKFKDRIKLLVQSNLKLREDITKDWPILTEKHKEYMKAFRVNFDEDANEQSKDEDKIRESNKFDASKIDSFKAAPLGIKLLMSTLPIMESDGRRLKSSINGRVLLPVGKVYITLMNKLHNSKNVSEMMENLRVLAEEDLNYRTLYKRITKRDYTEKGTDYSKIKDEDAIQIIAGMWKTFKKQSPDVTNVFVFENGEVVVGDATLSSAANQLRSEYVYSIAGLAKKNKGFFFYRQGAYYPNIKLLDVYQFDKSSNTANIDSMLSFLNRLGTPFTKNEYNKLSIKNKKVFKNTVLGIKESLRTSGKTVVISKQSLSISGNLLNLGILKEAATNPEFNSTYFNLSGERVQVFFGPNAASELYNVLSSIKNLSELAGTNYEYLLEGKDVFSQNSTIIKRMFRSDGQRKSSVDLFKSGYIGGIVNPDKGGKSSARLSKRERFIQELNNNIVGKFLNLVPGDASLEWALEMGNAVSLSDLADGDAVTNEIFKGFFISELNLSREGREIVNPKYEDGVTEFEKRKTTDLRFFKGILGETLHNKIIEAKGDPIAVYEKFEDDINKKLKEYIDRDVEVTKDTLVRFGLLNTLEGAEVEGGPAQEVKYTIDSLDLPVGMTESEYNRQLKSLSVNYMIANIEMHKILYSDPYQYKDELKRTKSFLSPRQALISGDVQVNSLLNRVYNKEFSSKKDKDGNIQDSGFTDFMRDYMRTSTHKDVMSYVEGLAGYSKYEETDGGGTIAYKSYRNFRIRANDWNRKEEEQYIYDVEYEKLVKKLDESVNSLKTTEAKNATRKRNEKTLNKFRKKDPKVQSAYKTLKPIVSGSKLGKDGLPSPFNNVVLDKYSLFPLSFKVMNEIKISSDGKLGQNGINLHNKLQKEDIDYIVFDSGRKVGAETSHETYNKDGSFNNEEYVDVVNVPFSIMSIQTEVPSKEKALVTRGSQTTKLLTLDYMESGVPIDFREFEGESEGSRFDQWEALTRDEKLEQSKVFRMIVENQELLEAMTNEGYESMLIKLGLEDIDGKIVVTDFSEAANTLRDEIFKREVNDNISEALTDFLENKGNTVLEGTPVYQIVRNILYSVVDKNIVRPKISGSQKVQISSALFESVRPEFNKDLKGYTSDVLNFYEDKNGKRVMEVMVGRWFNSSMSDKELLEYLNNTKEGQDILQGLAFRIPTQAQNSIDAIKIAGFLPKEFGDNVVVPSAIVAKVGSDFDIDKLSMYFKNIFYRNGKLESVPYFGIGKEAKDKFNRMFENGEIIDRDSREKLEKELKLFREGNYAYEDKLVEAIFGELGIVSEQDIIEEFTTELSESNSTLKETIVNKLYKQSLENEYIRSSEKLVSDPLNFEKLITPNDATSMKKLSNKVVKKVSGNVVSYSSVNNMLSRQFMSSLRHDFVTGKRAIGVAAVSQTGLSVNQRTSVFINTENIKNLPEKDRKWLGDGEIRFSDYNKIERGGKVYATTSNIYNVKGGRISNINSMIMDGFVDIAKGPWIMQMGITPKVAPVVLLLNSLGVPIEDIVYFINQPIIKQHLQNLENVGYSTPYITDMINDLKKDYFPDLETSAIENEYPSTIPAEETLFENLGKGPSDFNKKEKIDQVFMLDEFLKYSKMADQSYTTTQGSNYDTSRFNDPSLIFRKEVQTDLALSNIFSAFDKEGEVIPAVVALLDNSFIGNMRDKIMDSRNAISNFLISDRGETRKMLEEILTPYAQDRYLSDKDFVKIYRKAVNDLFDFAVQTDQKLNMNLKDSLLSEDGTASEVLDFINEVKGNTNHPSGLHYNDIVQSLEVRMSEKAGEGRPNNVTLKNKGGKAYDQNKVIHSFRELKVALKGKTNLYDKIVMLSILQSGLSPSPISFTDLIPYEDISRIYNKTLPKLEEISNLEDFEKLDMFQRNNYNNDSIVAQKKLFRGVFKNFDGGKSLKYPSIDFLPAPIKKMITRGDIPQVITQYAADGSPDIISATWNDNLGKNKIAKMRKEGDYSYVNRALMKLVRDENTGEPYVYVSKDKPYHIYKAINTVGDSFRAQEFYDNATKSLFDNGYMKVEEVSDIVITSAFDAEVLKKSKRPKYTKQAPTQQTIGIKSIPMQPDNASKILSGQKTTTLRSNNLPSGIYNIGGQQFNITNRGLLSIKEAGGIETISKSEAFAKSGPKFSSTKDFLAGKRKLYVYDISPINQPTQQTNGVTDFSKYKNSDWNTFKSLGRRKKVMDHLEAYDNNNNKATQERLMFDVLGYLEGFSRSDFNSHPLVKELKEAVKKIKTDGYKFSFDESKGLFYIETPDGSFYNNRPAVLNKPTTSDPSDVDMSFGLTKEDFDEYSPGGANPIEQEITVAGNDFIVGNARFPKSLATVEFLERRGYSPQLIKKIIDKIC